MHEALVFLDNHGNAVTALATVVLTVVTAIYVVLTGLLARENRLLRKAGTEPEVVAYLVPDYQHFVMINLVISNIGRGAAKNLYVEYKADVASLREHHVRTIFEEKRFLTSVLPQDEKITSFFGSAIEMFSGETSLNEFSIVLTYENLFGKPKSSEYVISLNGLKNLGRIGEPADVAAAKAMKEIAKQVTNWSSGFNRLKVETITADQAREENQ